MNLAGLPSERVTACGVGAGAWPGNLDEFVAWFDEHLQVEVQWLERRASEAGWAELPSVRSGCSESDLELALQASHVSHFPSEYREYLQALGRSRHPTLSYSAGWLASLADSRSHLRTEFLDAGCSAADIDHALHDRVVLCFNPGLWSLLLDTVDPAPLVGWSDSAGTRVSLPSFDGYLNALACSAAQDLAYAPRDPPPQLGHPFTTDEAREYNDAMIRAVAPESQLRRLGPTLFEIASTGSQAQRPLPAL